MALVQGGLLKPLVAASLALAAGLVVTLPGASASSRPAAPGLGRTDQRLQYAGRNAGSVSAAFADPGDITVATAGSFDAAASQGTGLTYGWDFGDGSAPATGATVQHTYSRVDDYAVRLTVRDQQGNEDTASRTIRVVPAIGNLVGQPELNQIVPAGSFTAMLTLNAAGPAQVSLQVGGALLSSERWDFTGSNAPALFEIPDIRVANEDNADIVAQLLSKPGASIPLSNNVAITLTYAVSNGRNESASYTTTLLKDAGATPVAPSNAGNAGNAGIAGGAAMPTPTPVARNGAAYLQASPTPRTTPVATPAAIAPPAPTVTATAAPAPANAATPVAPTPAVWSITYPTYLPVTGLPVNADDVDGYYLKGDSQFHSVDTLTLRQFAIRVARNGGVFPNDPQRAADNIYRYVNGVLGIGDPGELQKDLVIIGRIDDGTLRPGSRNGEYICIAHAYFLSSITRTLGLPTREETIGFGRGTTQDSSGAWNLNFYQEGANEVWYNGAWHHYDTWIGTRNRDDYLNTSLTEIAWYAFSAQSTPFLDLNGGPVGLSGHDFSLGKYVGSPGSPEQWRFLEQHTRPGVRIAAPGPDAYLSTASAAPVRPTDTVVAGILNPTPVAASNSGGSGQ